MAAKKTKINLLPQKGLQATTAGRILLWILSTFRIIVIITEIIVMGAFLSRFWLDARNTDLSGEIIQKQAVLAAASEFESGFKGVQKRLEIFSGIAPDQKMITQAITTITTYLPSDVFVNDFALTGNEMAVFGLTSSERSVQQLIVNLESVDIFEKPTILSFNTSTDDPNLLEFRVSVLLVNKKGE